MKAVVWTKYGPPEGLQLQEVEKPSPKDNELLIKIHATTVTAGDCEMRSLQFPLYLSLPMRMFAGVRRPTRVTMLGIELAGEIEAAGKDVTRFKKGDQVFGATGFTQGTYAEYVCVPEEPVKGEGVLAIKPDSMTYEDATVIPIGGTEALHFLRQANIQSGQKVLINGAGGTIGTFAVQLAKYYGAEVTAVDSSKKLDMLRSIGADQVIDYTEVDFTRNGKIYDVIFDVVGKSPFSGSLKSLREGGYFLIANPRLLTMVRKWLASRAGNKNVVVGTASYTTEDFDFIAGLVEAGKIRPVIGRRFTLEQIPEAHRHVEAGGKLGNVVITVGHNGSG